jgi:glycerol-3-phosphate O-acyltransferase
MDLYAVLRLPVDMLSIPMPLFRKTYSLFLDQLKSMEKQHQIQLQDELHSLNLDEAIKHGVKYLGSFHAVWPLKFGNKDNIVARNPMLVYYYHNRLAGYQLEESITWDLESVIQAQEKLQETE